MFTTPTYRIFYSGDSGFGKHFKKIAKDFSDKKIDLALIENGQYNENWKDIHMFPEEVAEVGTILKAKKLMPLHSGRFALSTHSWNEPFIRLDKASLNKAFLGTTLYTTEDLPDIDYLVISHDHWDHLEYPTVGFLKDKVKAVICPLGIRSHLEYWGFSPEKILEGDWNDHIKVDDIL